jgi:hypothetical protein
MIHTRNYRLTGPHNQPGVIAGISTDVPVLRKRLLRKAGLPPKDEDLLRRLRAVLDAMPDSPLPDPSSPKETQ